MWVGIPCPRCGNRNCVPACHVENAGSTEYRVISETICGDCGKIYQMVRWQVWAAIVDIENERFDNTV